MWFNQDTNRWRGNGPSCAYANLQMHCSFAFPEMDIGEVQKYLENVRSILSKFPNARFINLKYMEKGRVWAENQKSWIFYASTAHHLLLFLCKPIHPFTRSSPVASISERMRRYHWVCAVSWQQMVSLWLAFCGRNCMPCAESPGSLPRRAMKGNLHPWSSTELLISSPLAPLLFPTPCSQQPTLLEPRIKLARLFYAFAKRSFGESVQKKKETQL